MTNMSIKSLNICESIIPATVLILSACGSGMSEQQMLQNAREYLDKGDLRAASIELRNTLQENPDNAEARFLLGGISMQIGDLASAEKEFRRAAQAGWKDEEVEIQIARLLLTQREYQKLLDNTEPKETWSPTSQANILGLRALAEAGLGDMESAKSTLEKGAKHETNAFQILKATVTFQLTQVIPGDGRATLKQALTVFADDPELLLLLVSADLQENNQAEAIQNLQKIIDLDSNNVITAYGRKARIGLAQLQYYGKDYNQALTTLKPLLDRNSNDPEANLIFGMVAYEQGDYNLAEDHIRKLLNLAADHGPSKRLMGKIKLALKDYDQAARYLSSYLDNNPGDLDTRKLLAETYLALHQSKLARSALQPALSDNPDDIGALLLLSKIEFSDDNYKAGTSVLEKAITIDPENHALRKQLALLYIAMGETEGAIKELKVFRSQSKETLEADRLMIAAYIKAKKHKDAIAIATNMLESNPQNPEILSINGGVYAASGNLSKARSYYEQALTLDKALVTATLGLAEIERKDNNPGKAIELYEGLVQSKKGGTLPMLALAELAGQQHREQEMVNWLEKARESAPNETKPRIILANYYLNTRQPEKADSVFQEAIKIKPNNTEIMAIQSRILIFQKRYNEALLPLNELVDKLPESAQARALLGETYAHLGMLNEAHEQLSKTLEIQPDHELAMGLLAEIELKNGNTDKSLAHAEKLQRARPELYLGHKLEGDVWMQDQKYARAYSAYSRAWKLQQTAPVAMNLYNAATQSQSGKFDTAVQPVLTWLKDHPEDTTTRFFLATAYQVNSRNEDALREYEKMLEINPDNASALNNLAWLYSMNNDPRALDTAEKAYQFAPENPGILDTYGWILVQQGQLDKGRRLLKQALEDLPDNRDIRYHYAAALIKSGSEEEGKMILEKLLDDGIDFSSRPEAERLLAKHNASR